VFGELMYLLEYRDQEIPLASGGARFRIPRNVYLIGTMNTADRSIALVDHALRRRFSFIHVGPNYEILQEYLTEHGLPATGLVQALRDLNALIGDPNYEIGISFFIKDGSQLETVLEDIWRGEIEPYLEEYFYDQLGKVEAFRWDRVARKQLSNWPR
jgi:5-methylcytosine-specific restriction protein B